MNKSSELYKFSSTTQLEYAIYGQGEKSMICFHGFGQDHSVFAALSSKLTDYQVISINLLFHGKSDRAAIPKYLTHSEWKEILGGLLKQIDIKRFSIFGYSMGGRYTASTIHSFEDRIDHCILTAPDGIVKRGSYEFVTFPWGPEQLFGFFMNNPTFFFAFINLIEKTRLINQWTINFSKSQLQNEEQRHRVYRSWVTLKKLKLNQSQLIKLINRASFHTTLIFGKYDSIIRPKPHLPFLNKLKKAKVLILEAGHTKLLDESFSTISEMLNATKSG